MDRYTVVYPSTMQMFFIRLSGVLSAVLLALVLCYPKSVTFVAANPFHASWLDSTFIAVTQLGDGAFAFLVIVTCLLARRPTLALKLLTGYLISGGIAQLIKHAVFAPRPKAYLPSGFYHEFIPNITLSGINSFPSGHTTTAFVLATIFACQLSCRIKCTLLFMAAVVVMYSRIYLGQHFVEDVFGGMVIGILSGFFVEYSINNLTARMKARKTLQEPGTLSI